MFSLAFLPLGACEPRTTDKKLDKTTVSAAEVRKLLEDSQRKNRPHLVILIDPRSERDYAAGHIPGARNLLLSQMPPGAAADKNLEKYETIVVYGNDPASATARGMAKRLIRNGYSGVCWFIGGLDEWKATGGEVEPPASS